MDFTGEKDKLMDVSYLVAVIWSNLRRKSSWIVVRLTLPMKFTRVEANFFGFFPRTKWKDTLAISCIATYTDDCTTKP